MQTFSSIKIRNIEIKEKQIQIKFPDPIKTSGPNREQPILILPFFNKNKRICAASTLKLYLEKTEGIRNNIQNLFISYEPPIKAISSQTLSRWVKETLKNSGIDTDIYTAHSTRHVSTSATKRRGKSIDCLRKTVGWTKSKRLLQDFTI